MPNVLHPRLAVSTWSLHRLIDSGKATLLDIPAQVAAHGISKLEICDFHIASTDTKYLEDFRAALDAAGVEFLTLLIDKGDLTHPDPAQRDRDEAYMAQWLEVGAILGAERARVIAGDAVPEPDGIALAVSAAALGRLARQADRGGVRLVTENWHALLDRPTEVQDLLEEMEGQLGLLLDFGNWHGDRKYDDLPQIAPFAESTHAKAHFPAAGQMDREDFTRCLDICRNAGFTGPHSLIFDGPGDEWDSLDQMQEVVRPYVTG
ncbi:MAG: sugar phosphate isomerase/epimerase [Armatimonadota bacterium]|nr:sugar phosphate isomerase/epimerase [Armatimonadota bacterium]